MSISRPQHLSLLVLGMLAAVIGIAGIASASVLDDIPEGFADALGVDLDPAQMILSVAVIASVALVLAAVKMHVIGLIVVELPVMGMLTLIGWLDAWVLVVTAVVIAALFGKRFADWIYPQGSAP